MTTTTTTTTVAIVSTAEAAMALGIIGVVVLILALIIRELSTAYVGPKPTLVERIRFAVRRERVRSLGNYVLVAIVPLLLIFAVIVAVKVKDVLESSG